jgi:hypothetical protein
MVIIDHAADAFFHRRAGEIEKQPDGLLEQSQIGQHLSGVRLAQLIHGFDLNDQATFDEDVDPKCGIIILTIEYQWNGHLPFHSQTTALKSSEEDGFVNAFKESRAKLAMNANRLVDYDRADLIDIQF